MMRVEKYQLPALVIAVLAYTPVFFNLQYIGEESVYTIMSYEMNFYQSWMTATMYGEPYWRPPLFNWLIIIGSKIVGWHLSLEVARFISIMSSIMTAISIYWFSRKIEFKKTTSLGNSLVFITCWQISSNYGWLAYSDSLLNLLITLGIFNAILAARNNKVAYLYTALVLAFMAVLTKAITGYIHITIAFVIACYFYKNLLHLIRPKVVAAHALFGLGLYFWHVMSPSGAITSQGAISDISQKLIGFLNISYPIHLTEMALALLMNFLPWSAISLWLLIKSKSNFESSKGRKDLKVLIITAISIFLPYWIAPHGHSRYILPIYAPLAISVGAWLDQLNKQRLIIITSVCMIALKSLYLAVLFPFYVSKYRPDVAAISREIDLLAKNQQIYANDGGWLGIAVVDTINRNHPEKIIQIYKDSSTDGFVISHTNEPQVGQLVKDYGKMRLLCIGKACTEK